MSLPYISANWTTAQASTPLIGEAPFPGDPNEYIFRQMYTQLKSSFARLPLGTKYPTDSTLYLVAEGTPRDLRGGAVEWERMYARIPERRVELGETMRIEEFEDTEKGIFRDAKKTPTQIFYDYFYAPDNQYLDIPVYSVERLVRRNGAVVTIGGAMFTLSGNAVSKSMERPIKLYSSTGLVQIRKVIEDSTVERWLGEIYVRTTKTVRVFIQTGIGVAN